jgi:D-alanyl-lipoteichoic acid acyltransferase DltB (MBOAT superfamily)
MLFNSQVFLLVFAPLTLLVWYRVAAHPRARVWTLVAASFLFYGYWEVRLVPLLAASILLNWLLARHAPRRLVAPLGVAANLAVLGVFKYADFFAGTLAALLGREHTSFGIILPLGISFFTFQQISYLVDRARGRAPLYGLGNYALFVSFFPQLIAGPIVRHDQIIGQYHLDPLRDGLHERIGRGLVLLAAGLVKKVAFADQLAGVADPVFSAVLENASLTPADAWCGVLAFGFQIYFDFSGYSDMAIGLALLFGLVLPVNFEAPYRAVSVIDFWRRWHITLSTFLRDYLYIPLGGSRHGPARQALALLTTMLLGGLWHGAAWPSWSGAPCTARRWA